MVFFLQAVSESSRAKTFMVLALCDTELREKESASNSHAEYVPPKLDELLGTIVFVPEGEFILLQKSLAHGGAK